GGQLYDELAKSMVMVVVEDNQLEPVLEAIREAAFTDNPGDGKVFVTEVESSYTIRTGEPAL
nr:P-II family nitrogen regulator [Chloroflexota bacterium]